MTVSFVIPAHDEAATIERVIACVQAAGEHVGRPYEIVVVDDSSSDGTGELAAAAGARVVRVEHRQIAATRNSGARAVSAACETIVFVDADTFVDGPLVAAALERIARGAVAGGALMRFDEAPWYGHFVMWFISRGLRLARMCGGCFLFVRRDAFETVGGFDEDRYVSEELVLARKLKRIGRFEVMARPRVVTSGRKLRDMTPGQLGAQLWRIARGGRRALESREGLEVWYGRAARTRRGTSE
jgi:glycosyltransferase involved in cell wall biosynthesis